MTERTLAKTRGVPEDELPPSSRRIAIDPNQVRAMAQLGIGIRKIAEILGISQSTLLARSDLREAYDKGRCTMKGALRKTQLEMALGEFKGEDGKKLPPNVKMLIHLGKNLLGQRDR